MVNVSSKVSCVAKTEAFLIHENYLSNGFIAIFESEEIQKEDYHNKKRYFLMNICKPRYSLRSCKIDSFYLILVDLVVVDLQKGFLVFLGIGLL